MQIYGGIFAMQLYWNHTSAWVISSKFAAFLQNTFSEEHHGGLPLDIYTIIRNTQFLIIHSYTKNLIIPFIPTLSFSHSHPNSPHSHPDSHHSHSDFPHSHPYFPHSQPDSPYSAFPVFIPFIPFPDSSFRFLQIAQILRSKLTVF